MCQVMEDMRTETSIKTYIETCREFGVEDNAELVKRLLIKFGFLTEKQALRYVAKV